MRMTLSNISNSTAPSSSVRDNGSRTIARGHHECAASTPSGVADVLPFPLSVLATIAVIWLLVPRMIADIATDQAVSTSHDIAAQFKTIRAYYTENVVDKIVSEGTFKVSSDHKNDAKAIPLPVTMMHDLSALLADRDTSIHLYSQIPFPNRADRQLDAFQREAWDFLIRNPQGSYSRNEVRDGKHVVRVALADTMAVKACVDCHNGTVESPKKDWKLGDLRGVLEINSVIDAQLAHGAALSRSMVIAAILIGLLLLGITLLVAHSVRKPIEGLIGAMQKVAAGDFEAALPGRGRRDEIGQLAASFTSMRSELAAARAREVADQARTTAMQSEFTRVARLTTMGQMAAAIAHEINQPLAAIVTNGSAALRWLANATPNLDEARAALKRIVQDGHRAGDVIVSIREIFRKEDHEKAVLDVNELIRESLRLSYADLHNARVAVRTELLDALPDVLATGPAAAGFSKSVHECHRGDESVTDRERVLHVRSELPDPPACGSQWRIRDQASIRKRESHLRCFLHHQIHQHGNGPCRFAARSSRPMAESCRRRAHPHGSMFEVVLPAADGLIE